MKNIHSKKIVAFVPVRGGSKSIPLKNIRSFCGMPLIYWNLQELSNTSYIDKIVVATDSEIIAKTVVDMNFTKVTIFNRSAENATDTASTESVILEFLKSYKEFEKDEIFMLVQATSPFTERDHYAQAIEQYIEGGFDSLVSCVRSKRFLWSKNGVSLNYNYMDRPRRQDFKGYLVENGAFYISRTHRVIDVECRLNGKIHCYEMPDHTLIEIDEEDDWLIAESIMKKHFRYLTNS